MILLILLILIKKKKERFTNLNKFNKTIYVYWDKGVEGLPPLLYTIYKKNKEKAKKYGYKYEFITKKNIHNFVDVPDIFYKLEPNFQSDICRFFILNKYGGIWIDCDIMITNNFNNFVEKMEKNNKDFLILTEWDEKNNEMATCCFIMAYKNTITSNFCVNYIQDVLNSKKKLFWGIIGPYTTKNAYEKYKKNILLIDKKQSENSIQYINVNDKPGLDTNKWLKKNDKMAKKIFKTIKNYNHPIIITWTLYRNTKINSKDINDLVFNKKKLIFYYF